MMSCYGLGGVRMGCNVEINSNWTGVCKFDFFFEFFPFKVLGRLIVPVFYFSCFSPH